MNRRSFGGLATHLHMQWRFKDRYSLLVRARALAIALPASRIASAINSAARIVAPDWTVPSANLFALLRRSLSFGIEQESRDGYRRSRPAKHARRFRKALFLLGEDSHLVET